MEALLTLSEVALRTGQPVRRLRQWCATGSLRCERDLRGWLIPRAEMSRVDENVVRRRIRASERTSRAVVVPSSAIGSADLGGEVARRLQRPTEVVSTSSLMIDGQEYVIAAWPEVQNGGATASVAELAEDLGGELLD